MPSGYAEDSGETAVGKAEEGEDDVKSSWPLWAGLHTCYNGNYNESRKGNFELISKNYLSSDCSLQLESMKAESLVIVYQQRHGEYVPGPCTHRPSSHGSRECPKSVTQPSEGAAEGKFGDWG